MRGLQAERQASRRASRSKRDAVALPARRWRPGAAAAMRAATAGSHSPSPAARVSAACSAGVVLADGRGDAALRPGRGGALRERRLGEHDHRAAAPGAARSESGQAAADDDGSAGQFRADRFHGVPLRIASMRSTARRARRGDGGIDRHLVLHGLERAADLRQGDPLHVRAEVARPHEVEVGIERRRRCRSSSIRSAARPGPAARGRHSRPSPRSSRRSRPRRRPRAGIRDGPAR